MKKEKGDLHFGSRARGVGSKFFRVHALYGQYTNKQTGQRRFRVASSIIFLHLSLSPLARVEHVLLITCRASSKDRTPESRLNYPISFDKQSRIDVASEQSMSDVVYRGNQSS